MNDLSRRSCRPANTTPRLLRATLAIAAVVLLSACSTGTNPVATTPPTTSAPTASANPTATGTGTPTAVAGVNELVAGFPSKLIPLMKGAKVEGSSVQRSTPLSIAALTASITAPAADVMKYYSKVFTDQGFKAQTVAPTPVDNVLAATFVRGAQPEIVTISIKQTGALSTVTIGANVLPASLK